MRSSLISPKFKKDSRTKRVLNHEINRKKMKFLAKIHNLKIGVLDKK